MNTLQSVILRLYRGCSAQEAQQLLDGRQVRPTTHWCESYEKAAMYSKGAVVCLVFDEVPSWVKHTTSACEGDAVHGTFTQYVIPQNQYGALHNWAEEDSSVTLTG
jgi:hypothetical protein